MKAEVEELRRRWEECEGVPKESIQAGPKELLKRGRWKAYSFGLYADGCSDLSEVCSEET